MNIAASPQVKKVPYLPGQVIAKLKDSGRELVSQHDMRVLETFDFGPHASNDLSSSLVRLQLPQGMSVQQALANLSEDERVEYAEPNTVLQLPMNSAVPGERGSELWGLHNTGQYDGTPGADISALEAWQISKGDRTSSGPLIAVLDTGVDPNHPDLTRNLWRNPGEIPGNGIDDDGNGVVDDVHGYNAFDDNGALSDGYYHGTHVAGTIGAVGDNDIGITGVMQKARLMAVKIFSDQGKTTKGAILRGLAYATRMGADITNNSWGGANPSQATKDAFAASDALHVCAAGNSNFDNDKKGSYPANYDLDNIIAVAATDRHDRRASFSQWGARNVDVAAPGMGIVSTIPGGRYTSMNGTSMATPHVAGAAGLLLSAFPEAKAGELKRRLIHSSDRNPALSGVSVSGGRLNVASALEEDQTPPGSPQFLELDQVGSQGVRLSWLTPADDEASSAPVQTVELKVSETPIDERNYPLIPSFALAGGEDVGKLAQHLFRSKPELQERRLHFAAQAVDNVGQRSQLVTASALIPATSVVFEEGFDGSSRFVPSGEFRTKQDPEKGVIYASRPKGRNPAKRSYLTATLDLSTCRNSYLEFHSKTDQFPRNRASLEASLDGQEWSTLYRFPESQAWEDAGVDLSAYDGRVVRVRFAADSEWGRDRDGLAVSQVTLLAET